MKNCLYFNFKFKDVETKEKFKKVVKKKHYTMQSVFTILVENLTKGEDVAQEGDLAIRPREISYGYMSYDFFSVEKVYINGIPNGEYHIKLSDNSSTRHAVMFFNMHMKDCEVGVVDPILSLEYPIYIKTSSKSMIENIDSIFTELNKKIDEFRKAV